MSIEENNYVAFQLDLLLITGLKIMLVCFENDMVKDWPRIARTIRDMSKVHGARMLYWNFIEFVVTQRSPLFVLLLPFINQKVLLFFTC